MLPMLDSRGRCGASRGGQSEAPRLPDSQGPDLSRRHGDPRATISARTKRSPKLRLAQREKRLRWAPRLLPGNQLTWARREAAVQRLAPSPSRERSRCRGSPRKHISPANEAPAPGPGASPSGFDVRKPGSSMSTLRVNNALTIPAVF